jgi:hypothetical protein
MNVSAPRLAGVALLFMVACTKTETYPTSPLGNYYPLQVGKYIIYRMDSLVFVNSGQTMQTHSYLAKDTIDAIITDNLGRTTFRIHRYLTDTLYQTPWQDDITYTVTPTATTVELVENNLRFIPLTEPFTTNSLWYGNAYLGDEPYQTYYGTLTSQSALQYWQFNYENIGQPDTIGSFALSNTLTVQEANDSTNLPLPSDSVFANKSYGLEVYAAGIGLVYKSYILWDFQPITTDLPGYYEGFGVTQYMVAHN